MKLCVSSVESTVQNGTMPVIHIFGRDEYLRPHHVQIINYRPYFWCSEDTVKNLPDSSSIEVSSETGISIRKVPLRKIYTQTPYDIKKYAAMVEDFESDIAYHIKFMVDLGIKTGIVVPDVNKQYYDAAKVDGTSRVRVFTRITVPLLSPMLAYVVITGFIGGFKEYSSIVGIFGEDMGPTGDPRRLNTMVGFIYDALANHQGRASAAALILFGIIFVVTMINLYVSKKKTHY